MRYNFEWDPQKAADNLRKHRVAFELAAEVFRDPFAVTVFDEEHSDGEERWITMGTDRAGKVHVVVHTFAAQSESEALVRLISARKPTRRELAQYEGRT